MNDQLGDAWNRYGFRNLADQVLEALELEDEKRDDLTAVAARCRAIVTSERNRMKRIDAWIARQKKPQGE